MSNEEMKGEDAAYANGYQAGRDSRQFEIDMFRSNCLLLDAENERLRKAAEEFMDYFNPGADADRSPEQIVAFLRSYEDKLRSTMRDFPAVVMDTE
jgi:hypothetical protein